MRRSLHGHQGLVALIFAPGTMDTLYKDSKMEPVDRRLHVPMTKGAVLKLCSVAAEISSMAALSFAPANPFAVDVELELPTFVATTGSTTKCHHCHL